MDVELNTTTYTAENEYNPTLKDYFAIKSKNKSAYKYSFNRYNDNDFPICAWIAPPGGNLVEDKHDGFINEKSYSDLKKSGINAIYSLYEKLCENEQDVIKSLKLAEKYGLVYFVRDDNVSDFMTDLKVCCKRYNKLLHYKSFGGILVKDEPGIDEFAKLNKINQGMQEVFKDLNNPPLFYVNMLPSYATKDQLQKGVSFAFERDSNLNEYINYIDNFINTVSPKIYSYDYYPMIGSFPNIKQEYFIDLCIVKSQSEKAKIPFWNFIQCCSWNKQIRSCTDSEINFQVNMSLAFGSKGIQYFTYWTPYVDDDVNSQFYPARSSLEVGAMVGANGELQPMYYIVQSINKHIQSVGKHLINAFNYGVIQVGTTTAPIPDSIKLNDFEQLNKASSNHSLIGCYKNNEQTIFYVVNNSILQSDVITLNFKNEISGIIIKNSETTNFNTHDFCLEIMLSAGEGVLIAITKGVNK